MSTGELRKHGVKVRLQNKPIQLLAALIEKPGQVLTREELQRRLWAADTNVDFESGLNTAANRLRIALGDSPDKPLYVETLARVGYRFIAPVAEHDVAPFPVSPAIEPAPPELAAAPPAPSPAPPAAFRKRSRWVIAAAMLLISAGIGAVVVRNSRYPPPLFHQLTFRRVSIDAARFGPDGESVIYSAREGAGARELYITHQGSPESRPLGFPRARLASISHSGELALLSYEPSQSGRTLLQVPLNGGSPRVLDHAVAGVDWTPDGAAMAVIPGDVAGPTLEFPRGKKLYKGAGWLSNIRFSPSGREIAFLEHPVNFDDAGSLKLIDLKGQCRTLATNWSSIEGVAWAPSGMEIWFTASRAGLNRSLYAVDLAGRLRPVATFPGTLTLFDISPRGSVLVARSEDRYSINGVVNGEASERDLSYFDFSHVTDMSEDGRTLLFDETGEAGGPHYSAYVRRIGSPNPIHIGDGNALALSPDGQWATTIGDKDRTRINLVPLAAGTSRVISGQGVTYDWVRFFPDGKRLLIGGATAGKKPRIYVQDIDGSKPTRLANPDYLMDASISPDGKTVAGTDSSGRKVMFIPVDGGPVGSIELSFPATVSRWNAAGTSLFLQSTGIIPAEMYQLNPQTGHYKLWKKLAPPDLTGVTGITDAFVSRDEKSYVYSYSRKISELFAVDGWR